MTRRPAGGKGTIGNKAAGSGRQGLKRFSRNTSLLDGSGALNRPSLRRLARRAGVKRINAGVYEEAPAALRGWLRRMIQDAAVYAEYGRRLTITLNDILLALKRNGVYVCLFVCLFVSLSVTRLTLCINYAIYSIHKTQKTKLIDSLVPGCRTLYGYALTEKRRRLTKPLRPETLLAARHRVYQNVQKSVAPPPHTPQANIISSSVATNAELLIETNASAINLASPEVSPPRAQDIQLALAAYRDTVIARKSRSDAPVRTVLQWINGHLAGRNKVECAFAELDVVLEALQEQDAIMVTEDDTNQERILWFVA